ncbi:MAG: sigma-70 family RNA polymerase sigma factor [Planctomycetes bacterium]|nr:sigma-70 family RNA polymerase sigma factor [Planctomycetota bacterium]
MSEFPQTRFSLIAKIKSKEDLDAWDQFVLIYRPVVYRMARRRGMQDADAQDLVQNVLIRVANAIDGWEKMVPETKFRHWLRKIARNTILTALSRRPKDVAVGGSEISDLFAGQAEAESLFERELATETEREHYLRAAAVVKKAVDPDTWQAFELTVVSGHACEDVAKTVGKSVGSIYAARSRVMRRLREQILYLEESGR